MQRRTIRNLILILALSLMLAGYSPRLAIPEESAPAATHAADPAATRAASLANGTVVDGIRVGTAIECAPDPDCATRLALAKAAAIERHDVAPSAIGAAHFYMPYIPPGATLGGGGSKIVVFDLEDGSQAAVHTHCMDSCIVVGLQPVQPLTLEETNDHGPLVDPLVQIPSQCSSAEHPTCDEAVQVAIDTANANGFLTAGNIVEAHYYVIHVLPGSAEAAATRAEYIVDIYIAGAHGPLAETAIGVYCGSGPCQVVSPD
jgi:hypothetical protein